MVRLLNKRAKGYKCVKKGSSTVFLALIFMVVMMLFMAVCAILCYQAEKTNIKRCLDISTESEFGKFYRPLFEDYRLLYYMDSDNNAMDANILSYFIKNQKDMPGLLKLKPSGFDVVEKYYASDNGYGNVMEQMTDGIVYTLGEKAADTLYQKINEGFSGYAESDSILDDVVSETENITEDAYIQERILKLLRLVEGIYIKNGKIKCETVYVKSGVTENISEASSGIDSPQVWKAVKDSKWNISAELEKMSKDSGEISDKGFDKFLKKVDGLYGVTKQAYELAEDIDGDISDEMRKSCICDVKGIKEKLGENLDILNGFKNAENNILECMTALKGYHIKDLYFDYSTLSLKSEDNPVENLDNNPSGIVSFPTGDSEISSACISEARIYEGISEEDKEDNVYPDFKKAEELSDYVDLCKADISFSNLNDIIRLELYINEYFSDFTNAGEQADTKKALSYEKEYIISGKKSDRENIESVVNKIILIRTGESFAYLISDREKRNLAYASAAAIVGFTGMDALVRCTQYIILAGWAYEDACVDVSALLNGKKIPYLKKKDNLNIEYHEIPLFNKKLISEKAERINYKSGAKYSDFLNLFLSMSGKKKCLCRSMDIIQYNMKLAYSNLFSFQNAAYGAKLYIECNYPYYCESETEYYYR